MSEEQKFNTNDPVLIIVRKGRGGKGYILSPADSEHPCPCMNEEDLGVAVSEILNDETQPRVSEGAVRAAASSASNPEPKKAKRSRQESRDDEDEDEDDSTYDNVGVTDRILLSLLGSVIGRAQDTSKWRRPK